MTIWIVRDPITLAELQSMAREQFGDMVKAVVDVEQALMVIGGELHSDEEAVLLDQGSRQTDLWGINLYPDAAESDSMVNVRPGQANRSRSLEDPARRERIQEIVRRLVRA